MTDDYTPTTRTVRGVYAMPQPELRDEPQRTQVRQDREKMFDRWLALHDAELLERARDLVDSSLVDEYSEGKTTSYEYAFWSGYRHRANQVLRILANEISRLRTQEDA